jgi:sarcosine dehydrogenase
MAKLPTQARVVVIGAGIAGCSVAYHLARLGWKDVVILEKDEPSSGTTWHACGATSRIRSHPTYTRLSNDSVDLYARLEEETGQATGFHETGVLRLAKRPERRIEFERMATSAAAMGLEIRLISPQEAGEMVPGMVVDDIDSVAYSPTDGQANPSDLVQALIKGAKMHGATVCDHVTVTGITRKNGEITGVETDQGAIACEIVVNCAGIWAREIGAMAGVKIPIQPCHHFYMVTEKVDGLAGVKIPGVRDIDNLVYLIPDVGGWMAGTIETNPIAYLPDPIPYDDGYHLHDEDWDHFGPWMEALIKRMPSLENLGVRQLINGLEAFTPDSMFILGETPEQRNFFVAAGFNASGIGAGGGAGQALAEWIIGGEPPYDLGIVDIRRFAPFYGSEEQTRIRTLEQVAEHFTFHWPFNEYPAGRPLRRSAIYDRLSTNRACFGQKYGWERPNWFAPSGMEPVDDNDLSGPNWFEPVGAECRAAREAVALFDMSSFSKFMVVGADAEAELQRICAANVGKEPGRVTYTQLLNARGGIEADLTVSRLAENQFYVVTGTGQGRRDFNHIERNMRPDAKASILDISSAFGVLAAIGPRSRELLEAVAEGDFSNEAAPTTSVREVFVAGAPCHAIRMNMMGELGWELHIPTEYMITVYDALKQAGEPFGLKDAGYRAINSLRLEKGNFVFPGDLSPDVTPLEAGLGFAVSFKKPDDFIGRAALEAQRAKPLTRRLLAFTTPDPEALLIGAETIHRDGKVAGYLSTGGYGYTVAGQIGIGRLHDEAGIDDDWVSSGSFEIEVRQKRYPATALFRPLYDPENKRPRA